MKYNNQKVERLLYAAGKSDRWLIRDLAAALAERQYANVALDYAVRALHVNGQNPKYRREMFKTIGMLRVKGRAA